MTPEEAILRGYRRISNKYGIVSRIDRPDWLAVLSEHMNLAPADFYVPKTNKVQANWCDYYRRVLSKDKFWFDPPELARGVPSSDWDGTDHV